MLIMEAAGSIEMSEHSYQTLRRHIS